MKPRKPKPSPLAVSLVWDMARKDTELLVAELKSRGLHPYWLLEIGKIMPAPIRRQLVAAARS